VGISDSSKRAASVEQLTHEVLSRRLPAWRDAAKAASSGTRSPYSLDGYESYRANRLRGDYSELEMNFQSVVASFASAGWFDLGTAEQVIGILDSTRGQLEREHPNLDIVEDDLGRLRRLMIWISPGAWVAAQAKVTQARLAASGVPEATAFTLDNETSGDIRFRLDEAIGLDNRIAARAAANNGLQVRRLELVRNLGVITALLLILFAPVLVNNASLTTWTLPVPLESGPIAAWATTIAIAIVGATGAMISSLMQARDSPVTYTDYQVRGIEMALRILAGGVVATILYYLLSWNVVPVIVVDNAGTYLLVAFVSGFSERYFLRLVGVEKPESSRAGPRMLNAPNATASPPADGTG